jgi:hypothetical protein
MDGLKDHGFPSNWNQATIRQIFKIISPLQRAILDN